MTKEEQLATLVEKYIRSLMEEPVEGDEEEVAPFEPEEAHRTMQLFVLDKRMPPDTDLEVDEDGIPKDGKLVMNKASPEQVIAQILQWKQTNPELLNKVWARVYSDPDAADAEVEEDPNVVKRVTRFASSVTDKVKNLAGDKWDELSNLVKSNVDNLRSYDRESIKELALSMKDKVAAFFPFQEEAYVVTVTSVLILAFLLQRPKILGKNLIDAWKDLIDAWKEFKSRLDFLFGDSILQEMMLEIAAGPDMDLGFGTAGWGEWSHWEDIEEITTLYADAEAEQGKAEITLSALVTRLPKFYDNLVRVIDFLNRQQLSPEQTGDVRGKYKDEYTAKEQRIYTKLQSIVNDAITYYNVFVITQQVFHMTFGEKRKFIARRGLAEATEPTWPTVKLIKRSEIKDVARQIYDEIRTAPGFLKMLPIGRKIQLDTDISEAVPIIYKALTDADYTNEEIKLKPEPGKVSYFFNAFKRSVDNIQNVRAQIVGERDQEGHPDIVRILKQDYPGWDNTRLVEIANIVENANPGADKEALRKMAAHLKLCDDAYIVMAFATYYHARELLYPTSFGVDVIKQEVFRDMNQTLKDTVGGANFPGSKVFASTNFGKQYKEIPDKINNYPETRAETPDSFLDAVIEGEGLFRIKNPEAAGKSQTVIDAIKNKLKEWTGVAGTARKNDVIKRMFQRFTRDIEADQLSKVQARIYQLLSAIGGIPPGTISEAIIDDPDLYHMTEFLANITGKSRDSIASFYGKLDDDNKGRFKDYYGALKDNLDSSDEHAIKFLKHIAKHIKEILAAWDGPPAAPIGSTPAEEEEKDTSRADEWQGMYDHVIALLAADDEASKNEIAPRFASAGKVRDQLKRMYDTASGPRRTMWDLEKPLWKMLAQSIKYYRDKDLLWSSENPEVVEPPPLIKRALDRAERPGRGGTVEEKLTRVMESIIKGMLKEEYGKKELCD